MFDVSGERLDRLCQIRERSYDVVVTFLDGLVGILLQD